MFHPRLQTVVFAFFMALFMSGFMSLVISIFNVGLVDNIVILWLKAWAFAFCVAFPTVILIAPLVHKLTNRLIRAPL